MDLIPAIDLMNGKCVRLLKATLIKEKTSPKSLMSKLNFGKAKGKIYTYS